MIEAGLPNYTNYNWLGIFTTVTDRRNGATDVRRNGATNSS